MIPYFAGDFIIVTQLFIIYVQQHMHKYVIGP